MSWVTRSADDTSPLPRSLADLDLSQTDLFATVIEGVCPGCGGRLDVRAVKPGDQTYAQSCGWCELCLWGWSATIVREGNEAWKAGEPIVTCYTVGALA